MDLTLLYQLYPLIIGWIMDLIWGDPAQLPHPIVGFGKCIAWGDKKWNKGKHRQIKGGLYSLCLILGVFGITWLIITILGLIHPVFNTLFIGLGVFFFLAGKTLRKEVYGVFNALDRSTEEGRRQLSRIVGRNTAELSAQEVKVGALETLAENLSDGVVAPLFWYLLLGLPGMAAYKMINTLDSMIAYKNDKYKEFGCWAAHIDDVANYIPARLTAFFMLLVSNKLSQTAFVFKNKNNHLSPNAGYPESALAGILNCQFGGPNTYQGQLVNKPYIGTNSRELTKKDATYALQVNLRVEVIMVISVLLLIVIL